MTGSLKDKILVENSLFLVLKNFTIIKLKQESCGTSSPILNIILRPKGWAKLDLHGIFATIQLM